MSGWRLSVGLLWLVAGAMHFVRPRIYEPIVPPPFDAAATETVYASGVAEMLGGAAALLGARSLRADRFARWWLLATLLGVYPANVWMALNAERFPAIPGWALWARLPFQAVFAAHILRGTGDRAR